MATISIQPIDLIIIGAYLILMLVIGVVCVNRIKNTGDYYVAGRSFGPIVLILSQENDPYNHRHSSINCCAD